MGIGPQAVVSVLRRQLARSRRGTQSDHVLRQMRSAAVNVGPTFDVPLSRLRGKLDLRDSNRPFAFNRTTGT